MHELPVTTRGFWRRTLACTLLMARIMDAVATMVREHLRAVTDGAHEVMQVGLGMSIIASVFLVVQLLLFFEELWWRP